MNRRVAIALAVVVVLALAGAVAVVWQQRERGEDLDARLQRFQARVDELESEREADAEVAAGLQEQVERLRARVERTEKLRLRARSCLSQLADEDSVGTLSVSFGYITALDDDDGLRFDPAEWLVGEEANEAAAQDGVIEAGDSVPNDYYIRNDDRTPVSKRIDERAVIVLSTADPRNIPNPKCVGRDGFRRVFTEPRVWEESIRRSPYWLLERDGSVVRLLEQYLP